MKNHLPITLALVLLFPGMINISYSQVYDLNLKADPPQAAAFLSGGGSYINGQQVVASTAANISYKFICWMENGENVSDSLSYTFTIENDRNLVAYFKHDNPSMGVFTHGLEFGELATGECTQQEYQFSIQPLKGYHNIKITAPEGFQIKMSQGNDDFSSVIHYEYSGQAALEEITVRFCPDHPVMYKGEIKHEYPENEPITLPVLGKGINNDLVLDINVILEGAYTGSQPWVMSTCLSDDYILPNQQPYCPPISFDASHIPCWYYTGTETLIDFPPDVVDWLLIELRDAPSAQQALADKVIARQAALLLNTGKIIGINGLLPSFNIEIQENLFVVIYHRNHLGVMSAQPLAKSNNIFSYDFTLAGHMAYNNGHKQLDEGVYGMISGDADGNGQVQTQDKNNVWDSMSGENGYKAADLNLDGQVQVQDKNDKWEPNTGRASEIPGIVADTPQ